MLRRFAVFASGYGSNLQAIINSAKRGHIKAELALVVSDNSKAYALARAKRAAIPSVVVDRKDFFSKGEFEKEILRALSEHKIDFIALAGFMRVLSADFVRRYKNRILNIHPSLLPSFKGEDGIGDALRYGVKATGVTVHFVDERVDSGPIILQGTLKVKDADTRETLARRIHKVEHKLYPQAIRLFSEGKLKVAGRKVFLK